MKLQYLRRILGIAFLSTRWIKVQPMWLIQTFLVTIGFFIILYMWGGSHGVANFLVGAIVAGMWGQGVNIVAQEIAWYRIMRLYDMFVATELTPSALVLGVFVSSLAFVATEFAAYLPIALAFNGLKYLALAVAIGLGELAVSLLLGLAIALRVSVATNISAITNPISSILQILPPVFYPASMLPTAARYIAMACPTAAAAEIVRQATGMGVAVPLWIPVVSLCAWLVAGFALSSRYMKWGLQ